MAFRWAQLVFMVLVPGVAVAQETPLAAPPSVSATPAQASGLIRGRLPVTNKPYSLLEEVTTEKPQPDGDMAVTTFERRKMRDSAGRERLEVWQSQDGQLRLESVLLLDPVANTSTQLEPATQKAVVTRLRQPEPDEIARAQAMTAERGNPQTPAPGSELLGTRTIAGVEAVGVRHVMHYPAGWNGQAKETQSETVIWRSPEYDVELLEKTFDPEAGQSTVEVTRFDRGEPDAALFSVPSGYTVETRGSSARVSPPQVIVQPAPKMSAEARHMKISGTVLVYLVVDEKGMPTKVRVIRGIGHGLDEEAVKAVEQYRFRPATSAGEPIPVAMNIAVNFDIY